MHLGHENKAKSNPELCVELTGTEDHTPCAAAFEEEKREMIKIGKEKAEKSKMPFGHASAETATID